MLQNKHKSQLVDEVIDAGNVGLESLSGSDGEGSLAGESIWVQRITTEFFPMVEDTLREGTA